MAHISPALMDGVLAQLQGPATLHICDRECSSSGDVERCSLGSALVEIGPPMGRQGRRFVVVGEVKEAPVKARGQAVCYCICRGDWVMVCNPLQHSMPVMPGNVFSIPSFELWYAVSAPTEG